MLVFNRPTAAVLRWTSDLAHVVISLALVAATVIIAIFFFHEIYAAIKLHSLIKGFLHALGYLAVAVDHGGADQYRDPLFER